MEKEEIENITNIRVRGETKKKLDSIMEEINRKDFGRKIRPDEVLNLAFSLIQNVHIEILKSSTLTNSDRIEQKYQEHIKKHGAISKDEFLGILLNSSL